MRIRSQWTIALCSAVALLTPAGAQEKDIFNYVAQKKAGKDVKKIVFIADPDTHGGKGNHEFKAGAVYMARTLNAVYPYSYSVVHRSWRFEEPDMKDEKAKKKKVDAMPKDLEHADAVIVLLNHGGVAATNPAIKSAMARGAGFMAIHYGVEVNKGEQGDNYLKWIGGYFETFWSVNPFWTAKVDKIPEHETTRGVKPFEIRDEWYYYMRFVPDMKGVTPVLSAVPELKTLTWDGKKAGPRSGNEAVAEAVKAGKPQHLAWAYNRPDGGRGFGFTGYHNYSNLTNDSFRTLLLNAVAWTAKLEVPSTGVPSKTPTKEELDKLWVDGERIP